MWGDHESYSILWWACAVVRSTFESSDSKSEPRVAELQYNVLQLNKWRHRRSAEKQQHNARAIWCTDIDIIQAYAYWVYYFDVHVFGSLWIHHYLLGHNNKSRGRRARILYQRWSLPKRYRSCSYPLPLLWIMETSLASFRHHVTWIVTMIIQRNVIPLLVNLYLPSVPRQPEYLWPWRWGFDLSSSES